jgi:Mg-chelatase subunit ChlD
MSPELGTIDEIAFDAAMAKDADEALSTLAMAHGSSDRRLRELAKRLAGRVIVDLARGDHQPQSGVDTLRRGKWTEGADLDLDASLELVAESRALRQPVDLNELVAASWSRREHALTLIIDRSGSMNGDRLVAAALSAAVMACRAPTDYSVIGFSRDALVIKAQDQHRPIEDVLDDILSLRGHGSTNIELGLHAAAEQLGRSQSSRRIGILLSDGKVTAGGDPQDLARRFDELHVVAPPDSPEAEAIARMGAGRYAEVESPTDVPRALIALLR